MVTSKEVCEQFRRDLKSLNYYKSKLEEINDKLLEMNVKLQRVSSPAVKDVIIENKNPYQSNVLELMMQEENLIKERDHYKYMIVQIESKLKALPKNIRKICIELYVNGRNAENVALEHGYGYKMTMYREINKEIEKIYK